MKCHESSKAKARSLKPVFFFFCIIILPHSYIILFRMNKSLVKFIGNSTLGIDHSHCTTIMISKISGFIFFKLQN